jgi:phage FluMu gp28-like protein
MPSEVNPLLPDSELEEMRRQLPERVCQQEIDALFVEDAGGVFRRVMEAATATAQDSANGGQYVAGVDWARSNDFTVFTVLNAATKEQVYLDRFTDIDYEIQTGRLRAMYQRFKPSIIIAEYNSMGGPIVERLQAEGLPVEGFVTSNKTKEVVIRQLESAFEHGEIKILPDQTQIAELQAYEQERLAAGWRFGAPEGLHDDTVMALALAWHGVAGQLPAFL